MEKLAHINKILKQYFEANTSIKKIPAKDLMPYFVQAGIFPEDERSGLPIRKVLRQLDKANRLSEIPYVIAERKDKNTNWYFGSTTTKVSIVSQPRVIAKQSVKANNRKNSDEHYIIDLCDKALGIEGSRQHRFTFLLGDPGKTGNRVKLPVDVYYEPLSLVIEYNEPQHTKPVKHFDKPEKMTVSGVHRGEQRKLYDTRKRTVLPKHNIKVVVIPYSAFDCNSKGKLNRSKKNDIEIVKQFLKDFLE